LGQHACQRSNLFRLRFFLDSDELPAMALVIVAVP